MDEHNETTREESNFRAFLSYSHADARLVRKLHSQLEAYRLPKGLGPIGSQTMGSPSKPRELGKIFRDREYLAVAQDLSSSVKSALERSEVLVVVCSPQAKASHWVTREIEYFRSLHKDRPILAALVEGEPRDAFPEALIEDGVEPLAADLRKEGDGWKLGFLKLVAGIAGLPLDALVQRDSQRQLTRVMAVTGVVALFALCMTAMATIALQSRNEAQFQTGQAEELAAFMMGDLREDLRSVGRLDVMGDVANKALTYFEAQSEVSKLSPDSLGKRAIVRHAIGEIELSKKDRDLDTALTVFSTAFATTKAGLAADPDNPARIFEHAQSHYWLGRHAYALGDLEGTKSNWTAYRDTAAKLYDNDPSNAKWVSEAAYGEGNLCTAEFIREPDFSAALKWCQASLDLFLEAVALEPEEPGHRVNVANRYAWLGDAYAGLGKLAQEKAARLEGERYAASLLEGEPDNRDLQDLWLSAQIALGEDELAAGDSAGARERAAKALPVAVRLAAADPSNRAWKSKLEMIKEIGG